MDRIDLFIEVYEDKGMFLAPIETIITLFVANYCDSNARIHLMETGEKRGERAYFVDFTGFHFERTRPRSDCTANNCLLPNVMVNENTIVAGLCATLRQIIKSTLADHPNHHCKKLLGFKDACLLAPSESSVWTKFCEVDLIRTLRSMPSEFIETSELPIDLARFECHLSQPVRLHNLHKHTMSKVWAAISVRSKEDNSLLEHTYAEGPELTLADLIIFVCVNIFLSLTRDEHVTRIIPLTSRWHDKMKSDELIVESLARVTVLSFQEIGVREYVMPVIENESLYKSDPKRYKPQSRIYTRQGDVDDSLKMIDQLGVETSLDPLPFGSGTYFSWDEIPFGATPEGGQLPPDRIGRKSEQLENLCKPVLQVANPGDVIVDFCSGGGHLGILMADLLPQCRIILLENKEESLNRARERVRTLHLTNVTFYQCNLDYFMGDFDIGVSLHACGVATDLVIQQCIWRNAIFVCCPCCYGSIHNCHHLTYPRSKLFRSKIDIRRYLVLGHSADQTHDKDNAKTEQGYRCMAIIDTDRKLQAEEFGYKVHLAKLIPEGCTPKNHLLVGIPKSK